MTSKKQKLTPKEKAIQKTLSDTSHFLVIFAEDADYRCSLRARNGDDVQSILEAVLFHTADCMQTDPLSLAKAMVRHLQSTILPQSSDGIN